MRPIHFFSLWILTISYFAACTPHLEAQDLRQEYYLNKNRARTEEERCKAMKAGFPFYLSNSMADNKLLRVDSSNNIYSFSSSLDNRTCSEMLYGKLGLIFATRNLRYLDRGRDRELEQISIEYTHQWLMEDGQLCLFTKSSDSSDFNGQIRKRCTN